MKKILWIFAFISQSGWLFGQQPTVMKEQLLQQYNCVSKSSDGFCATLYNAKTEIEVFNAIYQKQHNENKALNDRVVILECCLCLLKESVCGFLNAEQKRSVKNCKDSAKITCSSK